MRIALSQFESPGDVKASIEKHAGEARRAAEHGCAFVLFPELSITGYRPDVAATHEMHPDSPLLDPLAQVSSEHGITIGVGVPLHANGGVEIGLVVFNPDGSRSDYAKQLLHADEEPTFVRGERTLDLCIGRHRIAPGICYEAMQPAHGEAAVERGATIYAASVAKHSAGMDEARVYLSGFAERHGIPVLLVNAVGPGGGFISAGRSAAWRADGSLIGSLEDDEGLLLVDL